MAWNTLPADGESVFDYEFRLSTSNPDEPYIVVPHTVNKEEINRAINSSTLFILGNNLLITMSLDVLMIKLQIKIVIIKFVCVFLKYPFLFWF